jgi:MFS family permease
MPVFRSLYHVENQSDTDYANTKGWIVSIATAGAVFGCLGCMYLTNVFGRKIVMTIGTLIYVAGILGQTFSVGSLSGLYASRIIGGMGIGVTTVLPSIYISEVSFGFSIQS